MEKSVFINGWTKEKVIAHIKENYKGRSLDPTKQGCMYRGQNGAKCAVGLFIPDSVYTPVMEGYTILTSFDLRDRVESYMPMIFSKMADLQGIHDKHGQTDSQCLNDMLAYIEARD